MIPSEVAKWGRYNWTLPVAKLPCGGPCHRPNSACQRSSICHSLQMCTAMHFGKQQEIGWIMAESMSSGRQEQFQTTSTGSLSWRVGDVNQNCVAGASGLGWSLNFLWFSSFSLLGAEPKGAQNRLLFTSLLWNKAMWRSIEMLVQQCEIPRCWRLQIRRCPHSK